jgi:riboflavin synthase
MFTGIIENQGTIEAVSEHGSGKTFRISSSLTPELKIDQSISHNGACLTVEKLEGALYQVTAIHETLAKTNLGDWKQGDRVNLERCLQMNGRLDGHIVQGHVDTTATCISTKDLDGSWEFRFEFPKEFASLVIEKGSVSLNGISLTIYDVKENSFSVAIIPYTFENTNMHSIKKGDKVNIEFDVIGKYVQRITTLTATGH